MSYLRARIRKHNKCNKFKTKLKRVARYLFDNFIHTSSVFHKNLQGSRKESGFKRAFATLSGQDTETFTGTIFLNVEQLEKQLDKEDFQEIGSMATFNVLETRFQMFITNQDYLDDEYVAMIRSYFIQYTGQTIPEFHDTLIQHLESFKKSINERVQLKREYDSWVNERQMHTTEEKVDTSKALDASSVDTESSRTESKEHDTSSRLGNDAHDDVADIRPIYDEEPMAKVQTTAEIIVFAIGQQHTEQPEFNNKGEDVQNAEECHDAFTTHYLPKEKEAASAKPHHMIASNNSRISTKNMTRFSSNDMVHNHYLEEAKKRTQEQSRKSEPSLMHSARSQSTDNGSKPMLGLRWVPTRKIFTSSTTKVDSEPLNSSNADITNQYECEQTLDVSAGSSNPSADADVPSQQELDTLFGPLYDEFYNAGSNPSTNIHSTSAPSTHTNVNAKENNNDQAEEGEHIPNDEFTNPFCTSIQEIAESSSHNIEQVCGNPSRPVQTRRQLTTNPKMCMYVLTVSTAEPKNIKEAMADSAWIEAM
nr:putative ribonuclease H-like domain-containing protein [Tanacetum cinerariifolium]